LNRKKNVLKQKEALQCNKIQRHWYLVIAWASISCRR